jgi:hypothetical protein
MAVPHRVRIEGSRVIGSYPAEVRTPFGAAVYASTVTGGAEQVAPAAIPAVGSIMGFADKREFTPKGSYDGFYEIGEMVPIVKDYACALITQNGGAVNIDNGDWLEVAALGDSSADCYHGVLEEAGSAAGTQFTTDSVAQAIQSVTMTTSYFVPHTAVVAGETHIHMGTGDITSMSLTAGDYILLEDTASTLGTQVNKVASIDSTGLIINLVVPAAFALATDHDLVSRLYHCNVRMI